MSKENERNLTESEINLIYELRNYGGDTIVVRNNEIKSTTSTGLMSYKTKESKEIYEKEKTLREEKENKKKFRKRTKEQKAKGDFSFMVFEREKNINKYPNVLTDADLTRLIYISTYIDFTGKLVLSERTIMTKDKVKKKLGLGKTAFNELYNKLIDLKILTEKEDGIYMKETDFFRGKVKEKLPKDMECTTLYIKNIRYLYENTTSRSHKTLSLLFKMIPYLNIQWNVMCWNAFEDDVYKLNQMTLADIAKLLGYSDRAIIEVKKAFDNIKTIDGDHVIHFSTNGQDKRTYLTFVDPDVIYAGNNFEGIKGLKALCKKNKSKINSDDNDRDLDTCSFATA